MMTTLPLLKALRQRGISEFESANKFLEAEFLSAFNTRFEVAPTKPADLHRAVPQELDLSRVLAVHEERVLQNDWTIHWQNSFLQLDRQSGLQPQARLTVCEQLDGHVRLFAADRELLWIPVRSEPSRPPKPEPARIGPTGSSQGQKPAANHPWR